MIKFMRILVRGTHLTFYLFLNLGLYLQIHLGIIKLLALF